MVLAAILPPVQMTDSSKRIEYVDRLRGLAVVAMFFVHSTGAWLDPIHRGGLYHTIAMKISGVVAPTFMFLAGISICVIAWRGQQSNKNPAVARRTIVLRGAKILLLGYLLHLGFWLADGASSHWTRILKVDILHCIGLGLALFPFLAWPNKRVNFAALGLFLGLPILGHITYCMPFVDQLPVGISSYLSTKPRLALFPFIPYSMWIALGFFVGPFWVRSLNDEKLETRFWIYTLAAALFVFAAAKGAKYGYYAGGLHQWGGGASMTKGLFHVFLEKTSIVLLVFFVSRVSTSLFDNRRVRFLTLFGKVSLFAYCVHLAFVYHTLGRFLQSSLSPIQHLACAMGLTAIMFGLSSAWNRWPPATWKTLVGTAVSEP